MKTTRQLRLAALDRAVLTAFESMAFFAVAPRTAGPHRRTAPGVWARLPLRQPWRGQFILFLPQSAAVEITRRLHGQADDAAAAPLLGAAVGEFANTIAGRLLAALIPANRTFQLGLPQTATAAPVGRLRGTARHYANVEGEHVLSVSLQLTPTRPPRCGGRRPATPKRQP